MNTGILLTALVVSQHSGGHDGTTASTMIGTAVGDINMDGFNLDLSGTTLTLSISTEFAAATLTSGGTNDYGMYLSHTLNDTGAAGGSDIYRGLFLDITMTDITGWDNVYVMDLQRDSASLMRLNASGGLDLYDTSGDALYWCEQHIGASKASAGGSGATFTVWNTATTGWLLDATTEYLYFDAADVEGWWDGVSDVNVYVVVALNIDETANDIINAELVAEYFSYADDTDDMDTPKTQTRTVNHDIGSQNLAGEVHGIHFLLDYDLVSHVIEVGDLLQMRFRLDSVAGGTDVSAVRFLYAHVRERCSFPAEKVPSFPTEG